MSEAATTTSTVSLAIDGMTSRTCVGRLERALSDVPAVLSVAVRLDSESARVQLGDMHTEAAAIAAVEALLAATAGAGFAARLRGYQGPPVSNGDARDEGDADDRALPTELAAMRPRPRGNHAETGRYDVDVGNGATANADSPAAGPASPATSASHATSASPVASTSSASSASPALSPPSERARGDERTHHAGITAPPRASRRDREAPPAYEARIEPGFAADEPAASSRSDTAGAAWSTGTPMSADADPRRAGFPADGANPQPRQPHDRRGHGRRQIDTDAERSAGRQRDLPPVLAERLDPPEALPATAGRHDAASTPDVLTFDAGTGGTAPVDQAYPGPAGQDAGVNDGGPALSDAASEAGFAAHPDRPGQAGAADFAGSGAFAEVDAPARSDTAASDDALAPSGSTGPAPSATAATPARAAARATDPRSLPTAASAATAALHPRLVEPGRVALTGRNVLLSCTVLTVTLLVPALLAPLGVSLSISPSLQFAIATVVLLLASGSVAGSAWQALRAGRASVELLAVVGALSSWLLSLGLWREGQPASALYFGTAAGVATLALGGQYLLYRTRRKAQDALDRIAAAQPEEATRIISVEDEVTGDPAAASSAAGSTGSDRLLRGRPLQERLLPVDDLAAGTVIMIHPGDRIPVDAIILNGETEIDESILTGDPTPAARSPGEAVFAGTVNGTGRLFARVERVGPDTTLARVLTRIEDAQASESVTERKVERVIGWLVPLVLVVAVLTGGFWLWQGAGADTALARAITVLVVAFPCALGLAAPAALIAGTRAAARSGILVRDAGVIEALPSIRTVAFEQTGSLTEGRPGVREILPAPGIDRESLLAVTVAIEGESNHPLADAVLRYAEGETGNGDAAARFPTPAVLQVEAEAVRPIEGAGIEGRVRFPGSADDEAVPVFIGSEALMLQQGVDLTGLADELELARNEGWTVSLVAMARADSDPMLLGALLFADTPRPGARKAVEALRKGGLAPVMLSPEPTNSARSTGATLGINETVGELEPQGIDGWVQRAREAGRGVAMVGDAIDDADTLDNADLAIAMSHDSAGRDVAIDRAPVTLMRDDVRLVPAAFDIGRRTYGNLRQNLGLALVFNAIGIPLAAAGLIGPVAAIITVAAGMVFVQGNAMRLGQWRPDPEVTPF